MHTVSRRLQYRAQKCDQRPLAISTRNMDDGGQPVLRPAQPLQQIQGAAQGEVDLLGMQRHQTLENGVAAARVLGLRRQCQPICCVVSSPGSESSEWGICSVTSSSG